ncbi:Glutamyl- and glutaminyl-tRNA synthetases [Chryseobacterium taklimakanense]|uniref:Glutamyl- and glutaminyl-tRNA synthetases n=1 Tax=Chryseobacterium taklimakanense TaxID=536441 RepID=A0A239XA69_9FLAO|nr:zinc-dependent metalloprotease [Chryseobacterium taklimakanense]SNV43489.1 Glutamyl- and glutaminyl-tRNA synthetases [Chryseobacterium taklimakanense]
MKKLNTLMAVLVLAVASPSAFAQTEKSKTDTVKAKTPDAAAKDKKPEKIKPYKEIITAKTVSDQGVITVHKVEDKYYFEIPDSVLKKDFLVVSRLTKAAAGMRSGFIGYAGDQISQSVVVFEKGPQDKIFIRSISYDDYAADSKSEMYNSVMRNNTQAIVQVFDIKAYNDDKKSSVIEVSDFVNADNELVSFEAGYKKSFKVGAFQKDKSFVNFIKSFPNNLEINTTKTFAKTLGNVTFPPGVEKPEVSGNYTVEINSSLVLLPENKMQARYYDPRVGYFTVGYTDFDLDPQGVKKVSVIKRWRLEPKPQDLEKYKRGELVEPAKPIVFYIDPATPKKWVPYLMQGVDDWKSAFEKAGFKNAIYAKIPNAKDDPEWSLEDARFSAIVYKPSDVPNASGPSIADPRTGEILESHINWYHNVMNLLRNWYFIQASPSDPRARKMEFDEKLMGELIRFVSSHEVGHTLGLRHNFGSSSTVPVEKLRDKKWLEKNGHTPSIMDYARFNYVAQPEDKIPDSGMMPRIGDYDHWAIEWGYRRFPQDSSPEAEKAHLNKWVINKLENPRLWFGTESNPFDPRSQSEQIGDDAMLAGNYGIKNLQRIVDHLDKWTERPNENYDDYSTMYDQVTTQFARYLGHVSKYIGGEMETPKTTDQSGVVYEVVSKTEQKRALDFLNRNIFETPTWLLKKDVFDKTTKSPVQVVENLQNGVLSRILSPMVLQKMYVSQSVEPNAYQLFEYMDDLKNVIFVGSNPDIYRRNLQRNYINDMVALLAPKPTAPAVTGRGMSLSVSENSDVQAVVRGTLRDLQAELQQKAASSDQMNRYHYDDLSYRIQKALDPKI